MIARVFPRRTKATPTDEHAYCGPPDLFASTKGYEEVHVSTFTWDLPTAEELMRQWQRIAPVRIGGPATGERSQAFEAGKYLKPGYVITSRGCPNRCWFCSVWRREGSAVRELPIVDGWMVQDDNLLACSEGHIRGVFEMLKRQKNRAEFTGGLEASRLKRWHVELLQGIKPKQMFFAYDTPNDLEPLIDARNLLTEAGWRIHDHRTRCYVLIGHPKDTFEKAERRLIQTFQIGYFPMAMLYRRKDGTVDGTWRKFQKLWARPAIINQRMREAEHG